MRNPNTNSSAALLNRSNNALISAVTDHNNTFERHMYNRGGNTDLSQPMSTLGGGPSNGSKLNSQRGASQKRVHYSPNENIALNNQENAERRAVSPYFDRQIDYFLGKCKPIPSH
jgi:hypothetical protein